MCHCCIYDVLDIPVCNFCIGKRESDIQLPLVQQVPGAAHTLGGISFSKLVFPVVALYAGHQLSPLWGMYFGLSDWLFNALQAHFPPRQKL